MTDKIDFVQLRGELVGESAIECLKTLMTGPEEVQDLLHEAVKHRFLEDPPEEFIQQVKSLRPLSRKFIARTAERAGLPLIDQKFTRSLGFFGDWTPQ